MNVIDDGGGGGGWPASNVGYLLISPARREEVNQ